MTNLKSKLLIGVSAASLFAMAPHAMAQTATTETDTQMETEAEMETDVQATDVQGGQVVVEQEDATVDVTVPEPDVNVTQGAPVVTVEQPQPEITVVVPEPTVRVQQQAPIITVEQAQPQITVRIPEPIVTVAVPQPEVDVNTGEPIIDLEQPEPVVRFIRPEPMITIEESEPQIRLEQSGEAQVDVAEADAARVNVEQSEAQVNVEQGADANVVVEEAEEPQVDVVDGGEANVQVEQEEAVIRIEDFQAEDFNADETGRIEAEEDRARYREMATVRPIFKLRGVDLVGRNVVTETGEDVGEIDGVGLRGDTIVMIVGVGGFLGLGENSVALPIDQVALFENQIVVPRVTQEQLENMPEFNENEVRMIDDDSIPLVDMTNPE